MSETPLALFGGLLDGAETRRARDLRLPRWKRGGLTRQLDPECSGRQRFFIKWRFDGRRLSSGSSRLDQKKRIFPEVTGPKPSDFKKRAPPESIPVRPSIAWGDGHMGAIKDVVLRWARPFGPETDLRVSSAQRYTQAGVPSATPGHFYIYIVVLWEIPT